MPEVEYATTVAAPVERVWAYVEDLNQWCHLMIGYEALEIIDDRHSVWTLRGDVGILTREVKVAVEITEWIPRERVTFVVTGITERLEGGGAFLMAAVPDGSEPDADGGPGTGDSAAGSTSVAETPRPKKLGLRFRIARAILRRVGRKAAKAQAAQAAARAERAATPATTAPVAVNTVNPAHAPAVGSSRLTFELRISPLGPMAPMLDLLMSPMLEPAAHDLADGIRAAVES
jgi:hypothetical protein